MCRQDAAELGRGFAPYWGITHDQSLRQPQRCSPKRARQGKRQGGRAALIIAAVSKCEGRKGAVLLKRRAGQADAFALGRDSLPPFVPEFPGSHINDGGFQQTGIAIAVPKGHPEALAYVTKFIEDAKASGSVRRAMDRAGMANLAVAPPER
jgi:ABC-type amino acid transport substrate-binding protein